MASIVRRLPFVRGLLTDAARSPAVRTADGRGFVVAGVDRSPRGAPDRGAATRAELGARSDDALRVATTGAGALSVRRQGAGAREAVLEDGVVLYPGAFPGADALVVAKDHGVEELVIARGPEAEIVYRVDVPPAWRLRSSTGVGLVEVRDESGVARLRIRAHRAWDADGADVPLDVSVSGDAIALRVLGTPRWPVVVDPVFAGTGEMLLGRSDAASVVLRSGLVLITGGDDLTGRTTELFDPRTATFAFGPELTDPRLLHTATLLRDGRVLIAGGPSEVAEVFDPGNEALTSIPIGTPRAGHTATLLPNGKVLLVGGEYPSPNGASELFDPVANAFQPVKGKLTPARLAHTATLLLDGRVLLTGGGTDAGKPPSKRADVYDWVTDTFASVGDMNDGRASHTATLLADGSVVVAGGGLPLAYGSAELKSLEIFDPLSNTFTAIAATMQENASMHTATRLSDGRVLFAGGSGVSAGVGGTSVARTVADLFDPGTRAMAPAPSSMLHARSSHTATLLADGRVFLAGGLLESKASTSTSELFDPLARSFLASATKMSLPRVWHTATALPGDLALIAGGSAVRTDADPSYNVDSSLAEAEVFDGKTGTSTALPRKMLSPRRSHTATFVPESGRVLLTGGLPFGSSSSALSTAELFDPTGASPSIPLTMTAPRINHTATRLQDGRILIAGGSTGGGVVHATAELFDPKTGALTAAANKLVSSRTRHAATLLDDGRVLLCGGVTLKSGSPAVIDTAEVFVPGADQFVAVGSMKKVRQYPVVVSLPGNRALVPGGYAGTFNGHVPVFLVDLFDEDVFSAAPQLAEPRAFLTGDRLLDGRALLAGGVTSPGGGALATTALHDGGSIKPGPSMLAGRASHASTLLEGGRVLMTGGIADGDSLELFDPAKAAFVSSGGFACERCGEGLSLTELPDGRGLLAGDMKTASLQALSPTGVASAVGNLAQKRYGHTATVASDGSVLLAGGVPDGESGALPSIERFDPGTGQASPAGALMVPRAFHTATRLSDGRVLFLGGRTSASRTSPVVPTYEILSPAGVSTVGPTPILRSDHAATLLSDGKVLVAGGGDPEAPAAAIEVFDPMKGTFTKVASRVLGRGVTAAHLPDGSVVLAGTAGAVRYGPAPGALTPVSDGTDASFIASGTERLTRAIALANGRVAVCADRCLIVEPGGAIADTSSPISLFLPDRAKQVGTDVVLLAGPRTGQGFTGSVPVQPLAARRPIVGPLAKLAWKMGETGSATGARLLQTSVVGANAEAASASGVALLVWRPVDGAGPIHVVKQSKLTDTSFDFEIPHTVFTGPGSLYVLVDGVASAPQPLTILPSASGAECTADLQCSTGFCTDGVCCDQACKDGCLACSAAAKGGGEDGVCGPIGAGKSPRFGCENPTQAICGYTGNCDGHGACELPGITTICSASGDRCQGGACKAPPAPTCDEKTNELVSSSDGTRTPCSPGRCRDHACVFTCSAETDCAAGSTCRGGTCVGSCNESYTAAVTFTPAGKVEQPCNAYRCVDGACKTSCTAHTDCATGNRCVVDTCKPAALLGDAEDPGACSHRQGERGASRWPLVLVGLGLWRLGAHRRRVRRPAARRTP